eukprot:366168-Chlamydomonas_euryale.AAC.2
MLRTSLGHQRCAPAVDRGSGSTLSKARAQCRALPGMCAPECSAAHLRALSVAASMRGKELHGNAHAYACRHAHAMYVCTQEVAAPCTRRVRGRLLARTPCALPQVAGGKCEPMSELTT